MYLRTVDTFLFQRPSALLVARVRKNHSVQAPAPPCKVGVECWCARADDANQPDRAHVSAEMKGRHTCWLFMLVVFSLPACVPESWARHRSAPGRPSPRCSFPLFVLPMTSPARLSSFQRQLPRHYLLMHLTLWVSARRRHMTVGPPKNARGDQVFVHPRQFLWACRGRALWSKRLVLNANSIVNKREVSDQLMVLATWVRS